MSPRRYHYVGPPAIREAVVSGHGGIAITTVDELARWLGLGVTEKNYDKNWIATFTIGLDEILYLAPRRSEHVACAGGGPVLSAGEIIFDDEFEAVEVSNQSTGYCPEPESWPTVEAALDRIGLKHPGQFTNVIVFRRCPHCAQRNIVKDSWYHCGVCDTPLPLQWNFDR